MEKVAVAISGGIDSLVAAYLLKKRGFKIVGIHFITGFENNPSTSFAVESLRDISRKLSTAIKIVNIEKEFKSNVVDYFINSYCEGKTPNPCLVCNYKIKFNLLANIAKNMGANRIATGHYARIDKDSSRRFSLKKGIDKAKDQSYFLSRLKQRQLAKIVFPIGKIKKNQVIKIANKNGLTPVNSKESQDICFIKTKKYGLFIDKFAKCKINPGEIINTSGKCVGIHQGIHHFTVGQRRGINCPSNKSYYVIKIDRINNCLIVGEKKFLYSSICNVKNINWISNNFNKIIKVNIQIRYKHKPSPATIILTSYDSGLIKFDSPQLAITPGQGAVFYIGNKVIGSGWLETV